jgi:hypothetical protein
MEALIQSPEYLTLKQVAKGSPAYAYLEEATKEIFQGGKYPQGDYRAAVDRIAERMLYIQQRYQEEEDGGYEGNNPQSIDDEYGHSEGQQPHQSEQYQHQDPAQQYEDWEHEGPGSYNPNQREDEDWGIPVGIVHEQVSTLTINKHKAYQKALTLIDKVTPNTKSRRLDDYLTEVQFHAELTYGNQTWETNPIALKAIVLTTFNMELRRQFLTKNSYEFTTWSTLQTWLKSSTDQTPDDLKLQAITKLRLNLHAQGKKSLAEYNTQFTTLLQQAMMDTQEHTSWAIQTYIAGLNTHISSQLIMNPVTNQHWLSLEEVKQCAYRLNYHNSQNKTTSSLAVLQAPPPPSTRGRGRSLTRGGLTSNRGRGGGARGRGRSSPTQNWIWESIWSTNQKTTTAITGQ